MYRHLKLLIAGMILISTYIINSSSIMAIEKYNVKLENVDNYVDYNFILYNENYTDLRDAVEKQLNGSTCKGFTIVTGGGKLMTIDDFRYLRDNPQAEYLDLSMAECTNNEIPDSAFANSKILKGIVLPNSLTKISNRAFYNCKYISEVVVIPSTVKVIGDSAFYWCSGMVGNLKLPSWLEEIGESAFLSCSGLTGELKIPSDIKEIKTSTFYNCSGLTSIKFSKNVEVIGSEAFMDCNKLTGTIELPLKLTSIGSSAFANCYGIEEIKMPNGLIDIGSYAFKNCTGLRGAIEIPDTVMNIDTGAFSMIHNGIEIINRSKHRQNVSNDGFGYDLHNNYLAYGYSSNSEYKDSVLKAGYKWVEMDSIEILNEKYSLYSDEYIIEYVVPNYSNIGIHNIYIEAPDGNRYLVGKDILPDYSLVESAKPQVHLYSLPIIAKNFKYIIEVVV